MVATFDTLPLELISRVPDFLDQADKKNARLVSWKLCSAVTPSLFHTVSFWPEDENEEGPYESGDDDRDDEGSGGIDDEADETNDQKRVEACKQIANISSLRKHVRRLRIHTERSGFHGWDHCNDEFKPSFLKHWRKIRNINFPSLKSVSLNFDKVCWLEDGSYSGEYAESFEFRTQVMQNLLQYLDTDRNQFVRELSLSCLQNYNDETMIRSERFKRMLQRLRSLRLHIATEYKEHAPESSWDLPEMHSFGATLCSRWIQPASSGLTRLALYWDCYWGYIPKVDFRGLHLPQLRHLELGT